MPRVSRLQTETNRHAITDAAARLIRERGIDGVSVADLMGAAGLTHGGFYGHFESKEALAAAACTRAFDGSAHRWKSRIAGQRKKSDALRALIEGYLSAHNRDNPGASCPAATLAGDAAREPMGAPIRAAYRQGIENLLDILSRLQPGGDAASKRRGAMVQLATLVGALNLARATAGEPISDEFLEAAAGG